jgi:hypothetical protein
MAPSQQCWWWWCGSDGRSSVGYLMTLLIFCGNSVLNDNNIIAFYFLKIIHNTQDRIKQATRFG